MHIIIILFSEECCSDSATSLVETVKEEENKRRLSYSYAMVENVLSERGLVQWRFPFSLNEIYAGNLFPIKCETLSNLTSECRHRVHIRDLENWFNFSVMEVYSAINFPLSFLFSELKNGRKHVKDFNRDDS